MCRYTLVFLLCLDGLATAEPQLIIRHAKVFTADERYPTAEAVAIENGRFTAVGRDAEVLALAGPTTRVLDAGGRLVTPGLIEAHVHLASAFPLFPSPVEPLKLPGSPLAGPLADELVEAVRVAARAPGDWIVGPIGVRALHDARIWRDALDAAALQRPVMLRPVWGHVTVLNSAALARLGIQEHIADPLAGWWGRDDKGRLDGRAFESAVRTGWERVAPPSPDRGEPIFRAAADRYARWGVTSIHLMNDGKTLDYTAEVLGRLVHRQKWTVYSWAMDASGIAAAWGAIDSAAKPLPPRVRIDGPKWMLDGTPLEQNAWQREDYPDRPGWRGRSNYTDEQLREILRRALQQPGQIAVHVVGDAETDRLFRTMESLAPAAVWAAKRIRIEHGDGIRPDTLAQAKHLGIVVTQNPTHLAEASTSAVHETHTMLRRLLLAGVPIALGSDAGGPQASPFFNIMLACRNGAPGEALTREEALRAYTAGAAYAERQESNKGRIAVGLAADLAVLSQDILTAPLDALPATISLLTIVDGEVVLEDPELAVAGQ